MNVDRPLTDAQERALIRLDELWDKWVTGGPKAREPWGKPCRETRTLGALSDLGLVELRLRYGSLDREARITEKGRELLRGMGD